MPSRQVTSRAEGEFQIKGRESILKKIIKENSPNLEKESFTDRYKRLIEQYTGPERILAMKY